MKLTAPEEYRDLTPEQRKNICNGCGPKGRGFLIPDTMYGLDISEVCDIHDFMYHMGETLEDKEEADRTMRNNLIRVIKHKTNFQLLEWLRLKRANTYYSFVKDLGGPAFWDGKA